MNQYCRCWKTSPSSAAGLRDGIHEILDFLPPAVKNLRQVSMGGRLCLLVCSYVQLCAAAVAVS